nr:MAG TPA: hypothetical protein [Caudoviricetes sp.]
MAAMISATFIQSLLSTCLYFLIFTGLYLP